MYYGPFLFDKHKAIAASLPMSLYLKLHEEHRDQDPPVLVPTLAMAEQYKKIKSDTSPTQLDVFGQWKDS